MKVAVIVKKITGPNFIIISPLVKTAYLQNDCITSNNIPCNLCPYVPGSARKIISLSLSWGTSSYSGRTCTSDILRIKDNPDGRFWSKYSSKWLFKVCDIAFELIKKATEVEQFLLKYSSPETNQSLHFISFHCIYDSVSFFLLSLKYFTFFMKKPEFTSFSLGL